jgi:hypothetical protein
LGLHKTREKSKAYRTGPLGIVVVAVDGEDGDTDVEVEVFIVDGREAGG